MSLLRSLCTVTFLLAAVPVMAESPSYFCYRFDDRLADAEIRESGPVEAAVAAPVQVWPPVGGETSNAVSPASEAVIEDNMLKWKSAGNATLILNDALEVYTPSADAMMLTLKVEGTNEIRIAWRYRQMNWQEMEEAGTCFFKLPVTPDGQSHTYDIRLDNMQEWLQYRVVEGVRLLTDAPATLEVERAEIRKRASLFADAPVGVREYCAADEFRQVLYTHAPARLAYHVQLPERPIFSTWLACVEEGNPATFRLTVTHSGTQSCVLEETVTSPNTWSDKKADLAAFSGQEVEIEMSVTTATPGQTALWSNPCLYDAQPEGTSRTRPNILFYLVDALRADHLNAYGYPETTAPALARLAETGILFQNCFSQETCTKASVMTLHTGVDSSAHGFTCNQGREFKEEPVYYPTLLREAGYETCAISQNSYAPPVSFSQKAFCSQSALSSLEEGVCARTADLATRFLEENRDRPFYLYIHTMEVHDQMIPRPESCPFPPPPSYQAIWDDPAGASLQARYDASIAYADYNFGVVQEKLKSLGLLSNTLIVFTSDHGYALGEHGLWEHGKAPYNHQIHVPLILSGPGLPAVPVLLPEFVKTADISATLLAMIGLEKPRLHQGRSLLALLQGGALSPEPIFSFQPWSNGGASALNAAWKLLRITEKEEYLYSMEGTAEGTAEETEDLSARYPEAKEELRQALKGHIKQNASLGETLLAPIPGNRDVKVDPVQLEILKSLGYIN